MTTDWREIETLPLLMPMPTDIEVCNVDYGARGIVKYGGGERSRETMISGWTHWRSATPLPATATQETK